MRCIVLSRLLRQPQRQTHVDRSPRRCDAEDISALSRAIGKRDRARVARRDRDDARSSIRIEGDAPHEARMHQRLVGAGRPAFTDDARARNFERAAHLDRCARGHVILRRRRLVTRDKYVRRDRRERTDHEDRDRDARAPPRRWVLIEGYEDFTTMMLVLP